VLLISKIIIHINGAWKLSSKVIIHIHGAGKSSSIAMVVKIIIHINGAQKFIIFINRFIIQILSTTSMVHRNVSSRFIIHSNGAQAAYQESSLCCLEPWSSSSQEKSPADASSIVMIL
jgi:hypothetical protein